MIGRIALVFAAVVAAGVAVTGLPPPATPPRSTATSISVDEFDEFVTGLADAGLTQFAPSPTSRTIEATPAAAC